jgi:hypothetical protein
MNGYKLIATIAVPLPPGQGTFIGTDHPSIKEVADKACPHGYNFIESTYDRYTIANTEHQIFKIWAEVI